MKYPRLAELLNQPQKHNTVVVRGWVRTFRANRFIALNDGSTIENLQCVVDFEKANENLQNEIEKGSFTQLPKLMIFGILGFLLSPWGSISCLQRAAAQKQR